MAVVRFFDDEPARIWACLEDHPGSYVGQETATRRFFEAALQMARAEAPWRLSPASFGH